MTHGRFELFERMSEMTPPLSSGQRYAAYASQIVERTDNGTVGREDVISECWGTTEVEARDKLRDAFRKWVDSQPA